MSFIQNLFLSRDNNANGANYVGQQDRIWWNPDTNAFYYSDGNTPGGILISTGGGGNGVPGGPTNSIQINAGNGSFTGSSNLTFNGTVVSIVGNVSANYFIGDGSQLTNLPINNYSNANVANYLPTDTTIININSNIANTNSNLANLTLIVANNSSNITTLQGLVYSNANVANYLPIYTGNISANVISATGNVIASGGNTVIDDGISTTGNIVGNNISTQGNVTSGNILTNNYLYSNGNSIFANIVLSGNVDLGNLYIIDETIFGKNINANIGISPEGSGWVNVPKIGIENSTISNTGGKLQFDTPAGVDIQFTPGTLGNILTAGNVVPTANNIASVGSLNHRYTGLWLGAGNINLIDQTLNQDQQIYANNGNMIFAGGNGLQFGQFQIFDSTISTTNPNANIKIGLLTSNAYVEIDRPLTVNSTGGAGIAFQVERSGLTQINAPFGIPANSPGALNIVASTDGAYQNVTNSGGMLHITGPANSAARITVDAYGISNGTGVPSTIVLRAGRGTANTPTATQSNDTIGRLSAAGWGTQFGTGGGLASTAIEFVALENFTPLAQGSKITFNTANTGSNSRSVSATIQANGVSFANNTIANSGITFTDGSFQNTAYSPTTIVGSATAATGISISPTSASATGNITITNTGVLTVAGTSNQIFVNGANLIAPANGAVQLSLPQDIATSSSPTFNTLTVNDLVILGNVSNVIPSVVSGKIVYVANTATQLSGIDTSGLISGNAANGYYAGILYNTTTNTWDMSIGNSIGITADLVDTGNANVETQLHVGNATAHLDYPYAVIQGDMDVDSYTQIVFQNHYQGANASADFVAVNNIGNDSNNYIDMGINSNVYNNTDYWVTKANDGYLYINGGNLVIGTQTPSKIINFFTGGTDNTQNYIRGTVSDSGLSMVGNVNANNFVGNTLATTNGISAGGNITGVYLFGTAGISTSGNVVAQNVNTGIVSATGNVIGGNIRTAGLISAVGNIYGNNLVTATTIIDGGVSTSGNVTGNAIIAVTVSSTGNINGANIIANLAVIGSTLSILGNINGGNLLTTGLLSTTGNVGAGNINTAGRIVVTGNVDAGNLRASGTVNAATVSTTGNITASYYFGNGSQLTGLNAFQTVAANGVNLLANSTSGTLTLTPGNNFIITGNASTDTVLLAVSDSPSFTGNVTGGNILTGGLISATGNIRGGNVSIVGNTTTANLTVTGISNLNSNANVKISGGSTGQLLSTDGAGNLNWISSGNIAPTSGTWIPTLVPETGSYTLTINNTYYQKIGGLAFCTFDITIASQSSPTGNVIMGNLPFTSASTSATTGSLAVSYYALMNSPTNVVSGAVPGSNNIVTMYWQGSSDNSMNLLTGNKLKANTRLIGSVSYATTS